MSRIYRARPHFQISPNAPQISKLYARLEKFQHVVPFIIPQSQLKQQKSKAHRTISTSQDHREKYKSRYDLLGRNIKKNLNPIESHSVLYNSNNNPAEYFSNKNLRAKKSCGKLPKIKPFVQCGKNNKVQNFIANINITNDNIQEYITESSKKPMIPVKQKTTKEVCTKSIKMQRTKFTPAKNSEISTVISQCKRGLELKYSPPCYEIPKIRGQITPGPALKRKFTLPGKISCLGLPTEDSYTKMVNFVADIKDIVNSPCKNRSHEVPEIHLDDLEKSRRDTADTGASEMQTNELLIKKHRAISQDMSFRDTENSLIFYSRPGTEDGKVKFRNGIKNSNTNPGSDNINIKKFNDFPEYNIPLTSRIEEVSPQHERDTTIRETPKCDITPIKMKEEKDSYLEQEIQKLRAFLKIHENTDIRLIPGLINLGKDFFGIDCSIPRIKFLEPEIIPQNICAYEK